VLNYKLETLDDNLKTEMVERQNEYWDEVAGGFHKFPPDVDWESYKLVQKNGRLVVICGRDKSNNLKAVAFIMITPHPHYACIAASLPLLYIAKESRKGREGIRLIKLIEKTAESCGAQLFMTHGGTHNKVAKLFEFLKYDDYGRYFVKVLPNGINGLNPVFKGGK